MAKEVFSTALSLTDLALKNLVPDSVAATQEWHIQATTERLQP